MVNNYIESFITKVNQYPNKPAVIFHQKIINYQELHQRSNDLAQHLISLGVASEEIIPLILERDPDTIVAMIGILKAGCAFLPISPITPCSRIRFILEDMGASVIMSNINLDQIIPSHIKIIRPTMINASNYSVPTTTTQHSLAYVMYTSGSTGNPKGVLIEHGSMINLFSSLIVDLNLTHDELFLALTDYTFDISLIELLMPLLCGASILLTEQGTVADGVKIKRYLEKNRVTFMQATPLSWKVLIKQGWKNDNSMKILVGGEKFKTELAESLDYTKGNVWNMYGPTETSMWSMAYNLGCNLATESVPLGKPIKNTIIEILDDEMNSVEEGAQGMLYIGGAGLARGYLNNPDLTDEKFVYHPQTQERLYKTGDLAIANNVETICYVGRTDDQLKYGGIRIEAGEIEAAIEQEPFVKSAVVKVHETEGFYKSLAAYIEIDEDKVFSNEVHATGTDTSCFLTNIYDETYLHAENYEHELINNCGWQSSFTGQLFGVEELNEAYQFIRKIIKESDLSDVLEVGCGTGSLLLEYIDKAMECTVVEISSKAIEYVQSRLNDTQTKKITFRNESIQNIHNHEKYSCVIVNSVIQYLPSIQILVTSISQLVNATKANGTIIIGDVRSLELMDVYLLEKIRANSVSNDDLNSHLNSFYYKSRDAEIVLSPLFFYTLKNVIKGISHVDISVKHGSYKNELNYFRYDVVLHINKPILHRPFVTIAFDDTLDENKLMDVIKANPEDSVLIQNIPNLYTQELINTIDKEIPNHVSFYRPEQKLRLNHTIKHQVEWLIGFEKTTHEKFVLYDDVNPVNALTIHLHPKSNQKITRYLDTNRYSNYRAYCREPFNPWLQKFCFDHVKLKVSQHVLSWVNPSVYIWIEKWPLTMNGKLDKKKLQLPANIEVDPSETSILKQLQSIWRNITGDNALVDKEFWVHGVSSLCMYFFLASINEKFLVNINYHEFHEYNTLEKLATYLEKLLDLS